MTLLLTTHYMDEAEALADRVAIIDHGKIVVEGTPKELIDHMGADIFYVDGTGNKEEFVVQVQTLPFVQGVDSGNGIIQISTESGSGRLIEILKISQAVDFHIDDVSSAKPTLGDVFLKYTGRQLRDK